MEDKVLEKESYEKRSEKFLELDKVCEREFNSETEELLFHIGKRGSAYLQNYEYISLAEAPQNVKSHAVGNITGISDIESLLTGKEKLIRFNLYHPEIGEFYMYDYEEEFDWQRYATMCNADKPSELLETGVPIEYDRFMDEYRPKKRFDTKWVTEEISTHRYAFITSIIAGLTVPTFYFSLFFLSMFVFSIYSLLLLPFIIVASQVTTRIFPPQFIANLILTGQTLPNTPYMKNFDGYRDYLNVKQIFKK